MTDKPQADALRGLMKAVELDDYEEVAEQAFKVLRRELKMTAAGRAMVSRITDAHRGSLDAAMALHEALLPKSISAVVDMIGDCDTYGDTGDGDCEWLGCSSCANNPARAWLLAILKAKLAEVEQ